MHPGWLSPVRLLAAIAVILPMAGGAGAESAVPPGDRLGALEAYAKTAQAQWGIPGMAIAIVKDDQVIYAKGFGVKRVGGTAAVGPDTVFEIGSTSKAFTAAVVAMQVDDGRVGWSDRVVDHLPAFAVRDPWVTREFQVADLMAQHSAMPAYAGDGMAFLGFPADYIVSQTPTDLPAASTRRSGTWRSGCACCSATAPSRASRS